MYEPKPISRQAIPAALERAERYRLLNQPRMAESICLDVLRTDPENREARIMLLLSRTDQFGRPGYGVGLEAAKEVLSHLKGEYERFYYEGLICERWGKALLGQHSSVSAATDWIRHAMELFEKAERIKPPTNDEAILHWNACVRLIERLKNSGAGGIETNAEAGFRDEPPVY